MSGVGTLARGECGAGVVKVNSLTDLTIMKSNIEASEAQISRCYLRERLPLGCR